MCPKYLQEREEDKTDSENAETETRNLKSPLLERLVVGVARGGLVDLPHFAADPFGGLVHRGLGVADRPRARSRLLPGLLVVARVVLARHLEEVDVPLFRGIAVHPVERVEKGGVGPEARKLNAWPEFLLVGQSDQSLLPTYLKAKNHQQNSQPEGWSLSVALGVLSKPEKTSLVLSISQQCCNTFTI